MGRPLLTSLILAMMVVAVMPTPVDAADSGGVQASPDTVAITPANPVEGGSITIRLTLYNDNNFMADDVLYKFYWNGVSSDKLISANTVDIPAKSTVDVEEVKSGLTLGEHKIWVAFNYADSGEQLFYKEIIVTGLADIEATSVSIDPENPKSGDSITISTTVSNTGSEDAASSRMQVTVEQNSQVLDVPSLNAGESVTINHTTNAPSSGSYDILVEVDLDDAVVESDENNLFTHTLNVDPRMDISHLGPISVEAQGGSLEGPWIVSGTIMRSGDSGTTEVPMSLEITDDVGNPIAIPTFYVNITGGETAQQSWTFALLNNYISGLPAGNHKVTAIIDPFGTGEFNQETTDNDRTSAYFDKYDVPDVSVDPFAVPSKNSVTSGSNVDWMVTITNSGEIEVKGKLIYTWEGVTVPDNSQPIITIQPGDTQIWTQTLPTESGAHTAEFDAQWVPISGSYDANPANSQASGSVEVVAQLRLVWSKATMSLVDSDSTSATSPLTGGEEYTVSINLASQGAGTGSVNYSCQNGDGEKFATIQVNIIQAEEVVNIECTFTATAPFTNINLIPSDSLVSSTQSWNWDTNEAAGNIAEEAGNMTFFTAGMIALICLILIVVLIAAVILTREVEEEVERDIFDYCPACDGELVGGEDRCPHCSFNLKKARRQFHDCTSCGESIPDLLSNCPYCGAEQDISLYFEKRERKITQRETVPLLEEDEEIDPETIHAAGYEGFDEAVKEFGYDADDLEDHWDENIAKAEAEVEAAYDRRLATEEEVEIDEVEALSSVTTTLKSIEETFEGHDIDAILENKDIKAHTDDGSELSASDADIRGRLFEITGEEGVMPGDEVQIGMGMQDRSLAGNALPDDAMDFSFDEEDDEVNPVAAAVAENKRRRGVRRRAKKQETAECGACGSEIPVEATECPTCGAKFE